MVWYSLQLCEFIHTQIPTVGVDPPRMVLCCDMRQCLVVGRPVFDEDVRLGHVALVVLTFPVSGEYSQVISVGSHDDALPRLAMVGVMRECVLGVVPCRRSNMEALTARFMSAIALMIDAIKTAYAELASNACVGEGFEDDYFPCLADTAEQLRDKDRDYQLTHELTELMYLREDSIYAKIDRWREEMHDRVRLQALKRGLEVMQAHVNETDQWGGPSHPRVYMVQAQLVCQVSLIPHSKHLIPSTLVPRPQTPDPTAHFYASYPTILPHRCSRPRPMPWKHDFGPDGTT